MTLLYPTGDDLWDEDGRAWREPRGFETYQVSFLGHVRSFNDNRYPDGRFINPPTGRTLVVSDSGLRTTKSVAQLVMLAWHSPAPTNSHSTGHLNGDNRDNRAVNLFWESRHEQNLRSNRLKRDACPRGHRYRGSNLFVNKQGYNCCRTCHRALWWLSRIRREISALPIYRSQPIPYVSLEHVLELSPTGLFPAGRPSLHEILALACKD